jgi:hypothetical protein
MERAGTEDEANRVKKESAAAQAKAGVKNVIEASLKRLKKVKA